MLSRRSFLAASAALAASGVVPKVSAAAGPRKTIALIGTEVWRMSHSQHFLDRFLLGYSWKGQWHVPDVELVSLYIDHFPNNDLGRATAERHKVPIYPTVEDALTRGTSKLAVDGVVIIGEHGKYPKSEFGQTLYPRYTFFKSAVKVFEASGRSVPVFNDKHLSTRWDECAEMVADSKRLNFPFLAGSSLPVTWRLPAVDLPYGSALTESVCVGYGGPDSYDFHGLETAQCMSERRKGGEVGIKAVTALRREAIWERLAKSETTTRLLLTALSRSQSLPVNEGYLSDPITIDWVKRSFPDAYAYFIEHIDGFKTTLFMMPPIGDFTYAGLDSETGQITSCQMYLPMPGKAATTAEFFNPLIRHVETMIMTGKAPYPVERTLLTSGMTMAGVESLHRKGERVETPQMAVRYEAPRESLFMRE